MSRNGPMNLLEAIYGLIGMVQLCRICGFRSEMRQRDIVDDTGSSFAHGLLGSPSYSLGVWRDPLHWRRIWLLVATGCIMWDPGSFLFGHQCSKDPQMASIPFHSGRLQ